MTGDDDERDDPGATEIERKERILHTRVPASLDRQLRQRARGLGLTVSTVVRHVLLNTFGLVEDIVTDGTNIALALTGELDDAAAPPARDRRAAGAPAAETDDHAGDDDVLGWHGVILHRNAVCDRCNAVLRRGGRAAVAVSEAGGPRRVVCRRCLARIAAPPPPATRQRVRAALPAASSAGRRRRRASRSGGA